MLMEGKRGLIMGVANNRSIAWGIAQELHNAGAELAFSYPTENLVKRLKPLAESVNSEFLIQCDVTSEHSIKETFEIIESEWGQIDFVVHAVAFSDKEELKGRYINTSRDNFLQSLDISCFSLTSVAREAERILKPGSSILTLSYYGAEKVIPNYNVMGVAKAALEASVRYLAADMGAEKGIRVNSISSGPIKTLAASAIGGFGEMLANNAEVAPLKRNVTTQDVGRSALYLLSDLGSGVTGENLHVDCGASAIGVGF